MKIKFIMKKIPHHKLSRNYLANYVLETDLSTIYFYKNIIVVEVNKGTVMSLESASFLLEKYPIIHNHKPWVYISNRIHSYAVDPNDYRFLENIDSLKAFGVVSTKDLALKNAQMESLFFNKPYECFKDLEGAFIWAEEILNQVTL